MSPTHPLCQLHNSGAVVIIPFAGIPLDPGFAWINSTEVLVHPAALDRLIPILEASDPATRANISGLTT